MKNMDFLGFSPITFQTIEGREVVPEKILNTTLIGKQKKGSRYLEAPSSQERNLLIFLFLSVPQRLT